MSALAGCLALHGTLPLQGVVEQMLNAMPHRSPHGRGIHCTSFAGFGFGAFHTTPEERHIRSPYIRDNRILIFDGRLDYREELLADLGCPERTPETVSDHELVYLAWDRWESDTPAHLSGDFAFAIWDGKKLFCCRDRFGVKPLFYYQGKSAFYFASEAKALLAAEGVDCSLAEEEIITCFFPPLLTGEKEKSYYKGIFRLPPAHSIIVTPGGKTDMTCYWDPSSIRTVRYASEQEYFDRFRLLLDRAVRDRMRSLGPVGTALSGGLDSSAITCLARNYCLEIKSNPLDSFSCVFDQAKESDEREWIEPVESLGGLHSHHVHPDEVPPMDDLDEMLSLHEGPFFGANYYLQKVLFQKTKSLGLNVFLDGEDGDGIVSHGYDYLVQLAYKEKWVDFFREADGMEERFKNRDVFFTRGYLFSRYGMPYLRYLLSRWRISALIRNINLIHKVTGMSRKKFILALAADRGGRKKKKSPPSYIREEVFRQFHVSERLFRLNKSYLRNQSKPGDNYYHYQGIIDSGYAYTLELLDRMAAFYGVEVRHPFYDHKLAEFCLSVPPELKLRNGYTRFYFREAMKGILPEKVRLRGGKGDLGPSALRGYRLFNVNEIEKDIKAIPSEDQLIAREKALDVLADYLDKEDDSRLMECWILASYSRWRRLWRIKSRPARKGLIR